MTKNNLIGCNTKVAQVAYLPRPSLLTWQHTKWVMQEIWNGSNTEKCQAKWNKLHSNKAAQHGVQFKFKTRTEARSLIRSLNVNYISLKVAGLQHLVRSWKGGMVPLPIFICSENLWQGLSVFPTHVLPFASSIGSKLMKDQAGERYGAYIYLM